MSTPSPSASSRAASDLPLAVGPTSARYIRPRRAREPRPGPGGDACAASVTSASVKVPGRQRLRQMHDAVRPRPRLGRPTLAPDALDQHLERPADLLAVPLERDRVLERRRADRTAPARPLSGTWSSIVAARVPGRGEYWNMYALSNRAASTTSSVPAKSVLGLAREPHDDVGRHGDARDRVADPSPANRGSARDGTSAASPAGRRPTPTAAGSGCARRPSRSPPSPRSRRA